MPSNMLSGNIHSFQSCGTLDGPGIRFVAFFQGCPLRCGCCHNPDTWDFNGGTKFTSQEVIEKALRYTEYFGQNGGITLSGGEPLVQADFAREIFEGCKQKGINTCLDTSGCVLNDSVLALLKVTDRVLLDIKYTEPEKYKNYVGCEYEKVLNFLNVLDVMNIKTTLRQVVIPTLNDSEESILRLKELAKNHTCVDGIELLPFKKICKVKYEQMNLNFAFDKYETPSKPLMEKLNKLL